MNTTTVPRNTGCALAATGLLFLASCGGGSDCEGIQCLVQEFPAIAIVAQPEDAAVIVGQSAHFDVVVSSVTANPVHVQWQRCDAGQDCAAARAWRDLPGETRFTLTVMATTLADNGASLRADVRADDGQQLTSNAALLAVRTDGDAVFSDATFDNAGWTVTLFSGGTGGAASATQVAADGNPSAYREVSLQVNAARPGETASIFAFHWMRVARYEPQLSGPIVAIDYARDERLFVGRGDGQATALVLRQDGNVYFAVYGVTPQTVWTRRTDNGLTAADFTLLTPELAQLARHPDFSAQGSPIEFGFLRANSTGAGGAAYGTRGGMDNWSVTVRR